MSNSELHSAPVERRRLLLYLGFTLLAASAGLVYLALIPADADRAALLGFSARRWLLIGGMALLAVGCAGLLALAMRSAGAAARIGAFLPSTGGVSLLIGAAAAGGLAGLVSLLPFQPLHAYLERLRPFFLFVLAASLGGLGLDVGSCGWACLRAWWSAVRAWVSRLFDRVRAGLAWLLGLLQRGCERPSVGLLAALAVSLPLLFYDAFRYVYPTGYAGLYTLMADQLASAHFALPLSVPYYGPGGIPFAYPPLGIYLQALFTGVFQIPTLVYLRFAPPLFLWLALIPFYLLTRRITSSNLAAATAVVIAAGSERIFMVHGLAAGEVRSLGLLAALWGLYTFYRLAERPTWRTTAVSAACLALTLCSHATYVFFYAAGAAAILLAHPRRWRAWMAGAGVALGGALFSMPWWVTIVFRYGWRVFFNAFSSHQIPLAAGNFSAFAAQIAEIPASLQNVLLSPLFAAFFVTGVLFCLIAWKPLPLLWLGGMLLLNSEGDDRFIILVGAIIAGVMVQQAAQLLSRSAGGRPALAWLRQAALAAIVLGGLWITGFGRISAFEPALSVDLVRVGDYFNQQTASSAVYLALAAPEEAEWMPYLFKRTPSISSWGAEWLGNYDQQLAEVMQASTCAANDSPACAASLIAALPDKPAYLVTHSTGSELSRGLSAAGWRQVFASGDYRVWGK